MLAIFVLSVQSVVAQNIFKAVVKDGDTKEVLVGVNAIVEKTTYGASSDANGTIIIKDIPDGVQRIKFSYLGYETETKSFTFPLASATPSRSSWNRTRKHWKKLSFHLRVEPGPFKIYRPESNLFPEKNLMKRGA